MSTLLRSSFGSLVLLSAVGIATASAAPISSLTYDVTLTSWQINLTTHQQTFTLTGPGVLLTGTGYVVNVPSNLSFSPRAPGYGFGDSFEADNINGGTLAQGTVNGVTYDAANPLGLYRGSSYFTISPLQVPSGTNPVGTYPVTLSGSSVLLACTPDCLNPETIPFQFNFLPATGTLQAQFSGPDIADYYTLDSFNLTASSPIPEPASYASFAIGLFALWLGARISSKLSYGRAKAT